MAYSFDWPVYILALVHKIWVILAILGLSAFFAYWRHKGRAYAHLVLKGFVVVACSVCINTALKSAFAIPLNPALNKLGYAFPSGHMQMFIVLYGWLLGGMLQWGASPRLRRLAWLSYGLLAMLYGYALTIKGYHVWHDVMAAWVVGGIILSLSWWVMRRSPYYSLILCSVSLVSSISLVHGRPFMMTPELMTQWAVVAATLVVLLFQWLVRRKFD